MKKIVILGPESTGKSTLCEQLATHFKTSWVPEYARTYLQDTGNKYQFDDLWEIAKGQLESVEIVNSGGQVAGGSTAPIPHSPFPLFIDTDLYVIKIWSEISFNRCDNRILTRIAQSACDLYLLCDTDLPWAADTLREYPELEMRQKIYAYYKDAMINQKVPWIKISGSYKERLSKAINAVNKIL
ncbi:MAG: ATP-binding protein [Rhizobacter sp.]|nr:ATP-binding protein [Ferruginibacter sp.]